jgi:hypothetical protein
MTTAREASIAGLVANLGVEDMLNHFKQSKRHQRGDTWRMTREDNIVRSRCDYIMADENSRLSTSLVLDYSTRITMQ